MDIQVRCGFCGASNVSSAFSCSDCLLPLVGEMVAPDGAAKVSAPSEAVPGASAGPPPPPPSTALGPYTGPERLEQAEAAESDSDSDEATPARPPGPGLLPGYRIGGNVIAGRSAADAMAPLRAPRDPNRIVWRWDHVIILAALAWGVPFVIEWWLGIDRSIVALLNRSLAVQIVGYLVAALAVAALVWKRQEGDWSTLGLGEDFRKGRRDLFRGVGFGLAMFLGYLPVGLFTNGRTSLDPIVSLLLGNSNGAGLILTCCVVIVGAPVVEEIFFRGLLYEKIARRFPQIAILVTAVLFMLVHGAVILQILVLGLVFGLRRWKGETVWFTIGAHSAWNASVVVAGVLVLTSGAVEFTAPSNAYELSYARDWERQETMEASLPTGRIDLALVSANGSMMTVLDFYDMPSFGRMSSSRFLERMPTNMEGASGPVTDLQIDRATVAGTDEAYELTATIPIYGVTLDYQMLVARPHGSDHMIIFMVACPHISCEQAQADYAAMLETVTFLPS